MNKKQQRSGPQDFAKPEASGKCELEGFLARSGGASRESNPYGSKQHPNADTPGAHPDAATKWWDGWDTASAQLA
jgi:hypothetical protein